VDGGIGNSKTWLDCGDVPISVYAAFFEDELSLLVGARHGASAIEGHWS
jgi:hypothetical protein